MHGALEVELVEHGPADQADQQRVPPCSEEEQQVCSHPDRTATAQPRTPRHIHVPPRALTPKPTGPQARKQLGERTGWA